MSFRLRCFDATTVCLLAAGLLLSVRAARGAAESPANKPTDGAGWVQWDRASDRVVSAPRDSGAAYPRARVLSNGEILLVYHHGDLFGDCGTRVTARKSRDGGATWYQTQEVEGGKEHGFWGFSSPDFIELGHGRLLIASAARGKADPGGGKAFFSECQHSGLRLRFSEDFGATWGAPRMIASGRGRVWEPSIVRLPSGELEIFYAIEPPALMAQGLGQSIESIRSLDGGQTWSPPVVVLHRPGCRNGMPTALALGNGHVLCGQEVVGLEGSPWIADTLHGLALSEHLAQDRYEFGGAPFLARGPRGTTLLSFHSQCLQAARVKRLPGAWMFSQVYVMRGDGQADHFVPASCPWPAPDGRTGAFFSSLMVLNDQSVVVLASFITLHGNGTTSTVVRWITGRVDAR